MNLLKAKKWIDPKGQRPLLPKSVGDGYMLSAFVSQEFGFGRLLTVNELAMINEKQRANGATYADTHVAIDIQGTIFKKPLTESPFVKYLFIGANNEGYWNSFCMSLQLEMLLIACKFSFPNSIWCSSLIIAKVTLGSATTPSAPSICPNPMAERNQ
jgi:hypothetical protein